MKLLNKITEEFNKIIKELNEIIEEITKEDPEIIGNIINQPKYSNKYI